MPDSARLVSMLADSQRLRVFSRIVCSGSEGMTLDAIAEYERDAATHVSQLVQAGLVFRGQDGTITAREQAFHDAAAHQNHGGDVAAVADSTHRGRDVSRFFTHGQLTTIPRDHGLRRRLLRHLTERLFSTEAVYSEKHVNAAIAACYPDHSSLRRYLVDEGFLIRSADGREYRVAAALADAA